MKSVATVDEVKAQFNEYVKKAEGGPVVVTQNGRPVVVLVGVDPDNEIEGLLMAYSPKLNAILDRAREQIAAGKGLTHEEFWAARQADEPATNGKKGRKGSKRPASS